MDGHLRKMVKRKITNHPDYEKGIIISNKNVTVQLSPISNRNIGQKPPLDLLKKKFE